MCWEVKVAQSCPGLCKPTDYTVHGILQARILEWVTFPFSQPRDRTQVSQFANGFSNMSHKGSPRILDLVACPSSSGPSPPTQESNPGFLHCRWILYQLSYQGSCYHSHPKFQHFALKEEGGNSKRQSMDFYREFAKQIVPFFNGDYATQIFTFPCQICHSRNIC